MMDNFFDDAFFRAIDSMYHNSPKFEDAGALSDELANTAANYEKRKAEAAEREKHKYDDPKNWTLQMVDLYESLVSHMRETANEGGHSLKYEIKVGDGEFTNQCAKVFAYIAIHNGVGYTYTANNDEHGDIYTLKW